MNLFGRLALLFVVVPLLELALLVQVGRWVGLWPTLLLVFTTGVLGAALARAEGLRTLYAFQRDVAGGRVPGKALFDGLAILVGGALLLTPGILTDVVGFTLLLPPTRGAIRGRVTASLKRRIRDGSIRVGFAGFQTGRGSAGEAGDPAQEARPEDSRTEIEVGPTPPGSDREP